MIAATPGQVLGGRYRLEQLLGAGTVALVYEARDEQLEHVAPGSEIHVRRDVLRQPDADKEHDECHRYCGRSAA